MDRFLDELSNTLSRITALVADPRQYTYWLYFVLSYLIAVAVMSWSRGYRAEGRNPGLRTTLGSLFDRNIWLHQSAIVDYWCYVINAIFGIAMRAAGFIAGALLSFGLYEVLLLANGGDPLSVAAGPVALTVFTLITLLWMDLSKYVGHWFLHRVPLLWEFHKVHHSAQVLTPVSQFRVHPCDFMFADTISGLFVGSSGAAGLFVFGSQIEPLGILGLNVGLFAFYSLGANLRHSHVWLPYPGWLSRILISPAQHQIHHSSLPHHHDANYGVLFALWDWMFGTLYVPKEREIITFGLHQGEDRDYQTVDGLYVVPFKKIWRRLVRNRAPQSGEPSAVPPGGEQSAAL